jgi:Raf kinase inhibitor-like YbhB/YbcL family protein
MRRRVLASLAVALLSAATVGVTSLPASAGKRFTVTSPAFGEREPIPEGFSCAGADASLPLKWTKPPKDTEQLALVMDDPDAGGGTFTFAHWVAWGIDPAAQRLPEETLPAGVVEGASGSGQPGYRGPCPPPGDGPHRYRITVYALDGAPDVTPGTATADELRAAIAGHVLAKDRTVGLFDR